VTVKLKRLDNDGFLKAVREQWHSQILDDEGLPEEQLEVYFNQAKRIMTEKNTPDDRGMFVLEIADGNNANFDAMCFINHAWAKNELRVVSSYLAPKFDSIEHRSVRIAFTFSNMLVKFVELARSQWRASHVKIYIQDSEFRAFAMGIATAYASSETVIGVDVRSGWLHIDGVDKVK
jgi:hypothetical protein